MSLVCRYHEFEVALLTIAQGLRHKMLRSNVAPAESGGTSAATTSAQGEEWGAHDDTAAESDDTAAEDASLQLLFVLIWKRLVDIDKLTLLHTRKPVVRASFWRAFGAEPWHAPRTCTSMQPWLQV